MNKTDEKTHIKGTINTLIKSITPALEPTSPLKKYVEARDKEIPAKIKLPYTTHEAIRESFAITRGRIKNKDLETIPADDIKKIYNQVMQQADPAYQGQLQFPFTESQDLYLYKRKGQGGEISYYIPKDIVNNEKPSFPLMRRAYFASLVMAFEQRSPAIQFTLGDKLKKLGFTDERIKKGGKIFHELDISEKALAGIHFHYKNDKKGKDKTEIIGSFYSLLKTGEGKGAIYEAYLNPAFTKHIDFKTGEIEGRYIETTLSDAFNRRLSIYQRNIRIKAGTFFNIPRLEIYGSTLLEWANPAKSYYKHKNLREKIYLLAVETLRDLGFERLKVEYKRTPKDFRKWKLIFKPPQTGGTRAGKRAYITIDENADTFISRFTEWQSRPVHYGKKGKCLSEESIRVMITNTIRGYGLNTCESIFSEVNKLANPSPKEFWNRIKSLKARRGGKAENTYPFMQK